MTEEDLKDGLVSLLRIEYETASNALYIFAKETNKCNLTGYANLRDVLSHVRNVLNTNLSMDQRVEQFYCAREHIRRAGTESHQLLLERMYNESYAEYMRYRKDFMHLEKKYGYQAALDHKDITNRFKDLRDSLKAIRLNKDGQRWEQLIHELIDACDRARGVASLVKECSNVGRAISESPWIGS